MAASFTKSQRNASKLIYQGFIYNKNRDGTGGKTYWLCEQYRKTKCPGTAITNAENEVTVTQQHTHGPSPNRIELATIKSRIKQAASTSNLSPRALVNQNLAGISDQAKATLPKLANLEKSVSRKRRADGEQVRVPHTLAEIEIPARLRRTKTAVDEDFLLADSGPNDPNRIMIFASRTDLARLASSDVWVADGTFKSAPDLFYQLWVIHGRYRNSAILPFVFALLPSKTRRDYERALQMILQKIDQEIPNARPNTIIIDFEKAEEQAMRTIIPQAQIHGCYFHYKQCIWRKIQDLGWAALYQDEAEENFRNHLKMFAALTFADIGNVRNWFRQLALIFLEVFGDGDPDGPHHSFVDYMERTWVGRDFMPPRFPLEMWNNKSITLDQMPRTTNSAESWHNVFSAVFHRHSPNPYKLISALLDEQVRIDALVVKIASGDAPPLFSRREYRVANERLLNVLRGVGGPRNPIEFLTACSHYISFN